MFLRKMIARLGGSTLVELLLVMIISGVLFLLLFDSLDIIRRFGDQLTDRINQKSNLLYSHQIMEGLFEHSDSIQKQDNQLHFYQYGASNTFLTIDSLHLLLHESNRVDTLFENLCHLTTHSVEENALLVDSFCITVQMGRDTIQLYYGLFGYSVNLTEKIFEDEQF